jgi:integrase
MPRPQSNHSTLNNEGTPAAARWRLEGRNYIALYTGSRLQDVANMRWESVDLQTTGISLRAGKTKQRSEAPDARGTS